MILTTATRNEVDSSELSNDTVKAFKVQDCLQVRHAFTHGYLKFAPAALECGSKAVAQA